MIMDNLVEKVLTLLSQLKKKTEKSTEMLLIDDLSKRLLELEFKSNHSIKSKCLKWIVKKKYCQITKNEKYEIKNKTNKSWKRTWNNVLFRV